MNRRTFIKSLAGLAALTVVPVGLTAKAHIESLVDEIRRTGVLQGQTIYLDAPLDLRAIENVLITECWFVATEKFPRDEPMLYVNDGAIHYCMFDGSGRAAGVVAETLHVDDVVMDL